MITTDYHVFHEILVAGKSVVTVRLTPELRGRLKTIAAAMERPRSWVINRAIEQFVDEQAWQIEEIKRGLVEADAGDFATDAEVAAVFSKRRTRRRAR
jgi:predicted transcriptional regulator